MTPWRSSPRSSSRSRTSAARYSPRSRPPAAPSSDGADAGELFDRGDAGGHLGHAVRPEGTRALGERGALDLLAGRLRGRELLQPLGDFQQLEDAHAPAVARAAAAGAAAGAVKDATLERCDRFRIHA